MTLSTRVKKIEQSSMNNNACYALTCSLESFPSEDDLREAAKVSKFGGVIVYLTDYSTTSPLDHKEFKDRLEERRKAISAKVEEFKK